MQQLSGLDATFLYLETPEMPMPEGMRSSGVSTSNARQEVAVSAAARCPPAEWPQTAMRLPSSR